jgi:hypothetical protein
LACRHTHNAQDRRSSSSSVSSNSTDNRHLRGGSGRRCADGHSACHARDSGCSSWRRIRLTAALHSRPLGQLPAAGVTLRCPPTAALLLPRQCNPCMCAAGATALLLQGPHMEGQPVDQLRRREVVWVAALPRAAAAAAAAARPAAAALPVEVGVAGNGSCAIEPRQP